MLRYIFAALWFIAAAAPAFAQSSDRVALVIGNAAYEHLPQLNSPVRDAEAVGAALERIEFEVTLGRDLDLRGMQEAFAEFGERATAADIAVVYYAGHEITIAEGSFLLPIGTRFFSYSI